MLEIKKSNPWIFWPSSICDTLPEKPANKILSGEHYFKLKISGEALNINNEKQTVFCILPEYTGLDISKNNLTLTITYNTGPEYYILPSVIKDKFEISIEHIPNHNITIFINEHKEQYKLSENKSFGSAPSPHIILGSGNFPKNNFNLNYASINLNSFTIKDSKEIITNHDFTNFIYDKSVDKTGNCNFIHKL